MAFRVKAVWFKEPAVIAARNLTSINFEKDKTYRGEWAAQGLIVHVLNDPNPFVVGHVNIRSAQLYGEALGLGAELPAEGSEERIASLANAEAQALLANAQAAGTIGAGDVEDQVAPRPAKALRRGR